MKRKKLWSIMLVGMMTASLALAGCGSKSKSGETQKTDDGKIQIDFWYSGGKTAVNVLSDLVEEFNKSQDKYEIKGTTQADYTETYEKLQAGIAGKNAPDLALLDVDKSRNLYRKDQVADLMPFLEEDKDFDRDDYIEVFFDQGLDADGKELFAIPAYGTTQVLYYNKAAFEEAGIDPASIKTWQDLEEAAKKMSKGEAFYGWEPMWGYANLMDAAFSNGASIFSEDRQ